MAEAQNKLGELFVDIGSNGIGKLVKGLNTISASFLLGKKGAQEFMRPLAQIDKTAMSSVIGYDKLNAVTGISQLRLHQLDVWAKKNNISFEMLAGQVQNLQRNIHDIQMGQGGNMKGFSMLGIDPRSLDFNKPIEDLNTIMNRVNQLQDPSTKAYALDMLGLSQDLVYAWQQGNNQLDKRIMLNNQDLANLRTQQGLWNNLKVTWNEALSKFISQQTWLNTLLKKCNDWLNQVFVKVGDLSKQKWFGDAQDSVKFLGEELKLVWNLLKKIHSAIGAFGRWFGKNQVDDSTLTMMSGLQGNPLLRYKIVKEQQEQQRQYILKAQEEQRKQNQKIQATQKQQVKKAQPAKSTYTMQKMANPLNVSAQPTYGAVQLTPAQRAEYSSYQLTPAPNIQRNNVNMNITQNITAPDPQSAGKQAGEGLQDAMNNKLLQFQNTGGV